MGVVASCWQAVADDGTSDIETKRAKNEVTSVAAIFEMIDKERKGFVDKRNLDDMMRNDNTLFGSKGSNYILEKYGADGKMTIEQFTNWWHSTYTTYNDDTIGQILQETAQRETGNQTTPIEIPRKFDLSTTRS